MASAATQTEPQQEAAKALPGACAFASSTPLAPSSSHIPSCQLVGVTAYALVFCELPLPDLSPHTDKESCLVSTGKIL